MNLHVTNSTYRKRKHKSLDGSVAGVPYRRPRGRLIVAAQEIGHTLRGPGSSGRGDMYDPFDPEYVSVDPGYEPYVAGNGSSPATPRLRLGVPADLSAPSEPDVLSYEQSLQMTELADEVLQQRIEEIEASGLQAAHEPPWQEVPHYALYTHHPTALENMVGEQPALLEQHGLPDPTQDMPGQPEYEAMLMTQDMFEQLMHEAAEAQSTPMPDPHRDDPFEQMQTMYDQQMQMMDPYMMPGPDVMPGPG